LSKKIESVIKKKNLLKKRISEIDGLIGKFCQIVKESISQSFSNSSKKLRREHFETYFTKTACSCKQDKDATRKNSQASISDEHRC
jgi:Zn finger protein HypA/HybF involved in hydrogenase expression